MTQPSGRPKVKISVRDNDMGWDKCTYDAVPLNAPDSVPSKQGVLYQGVDAYLSEVAGRTGMLPVIVWGA